MIPTRKTEDLVLGSWELIKQLGRVPRRLLWDNEPGIGRGKRHADGIDSFRGTLATRLVLLPPRDPESKGIVERRNGWFETSFMPGRSFASPADFNEQFTTWLMLANRRMVRTLRAAPADLIDADLAGMLPLPPIPLHLGWRNRIRLGRDYYVRIDTNDYSVDPSVIGRLVDVTADLERVRADGRIVAEHERIWARGMTITDPVHVETAARLRTQFQHRPAVHPADDLVPGLGRRRSRVRAHWGTELMAATTPPDAVKQITYLAAALNAPRIIEAATRLADQARDAGWTHEDYLAAVLEREVSARNAWGGSSPRPATWSSSDRPELGKPISRQRWGSPRPGTGTGCCSVPQRTGSPISATPTGRDASPQS
jgi:hypothetical protein